MKSISGLIVAAIAFMTSTAWGNVRLPMLISDGMVLQRDAPVKIWGWSSPLEDVRIEFLGENHRTRADQEGKWTVTLGPFSAGGPFEMDITGANQIKLRDVLIGDVWLASGQSNMDMPLAPRDGFKGVDNATEEIATAVYPKMRLFTLERAAATAPKDDAASSGWRAVTPPDASQFSAVAYFFGRELQQRYRVPIGIIESVWGGTFAESWMSRQALAPFPELAAEADHLDEQLKTYFDDVLPGERSWYRHHGADDRGYLLGQKSWADPDLDAHEWPKLHIPLADRAITRNVNNFGGTVWLRREVSIPDDSSNCSLFLQLGNMQGNGTTFWNGVLVGLTDGSSNDYGFYVSKAHVRAGKNVISVRVSGDHVDDYSVGLFGPAEQMKVWACGTQLPLAGQWSYQPGPELGGFPAPDPSLGDRLYSLTPPPTTLFNGMIHPIGQYRLKGIIWYQGEANAIDNRATQYRALFPDLIRDWRELWGYEVPFLFVQLAGWGPEGIDPEPVTLRGWPELREAQDMTLAVPKTGMATAIDLGETDNIHPRNKKVVGQRLALVAENKVYAENVVSSGPRYQSMTIEGQRVRIRYTNIGSGLVVRDRYGYLLGFEISGTDGKFVPARATLDGNTVLVSCTSIQRPVNVRYDWNSFPDGNLYNSEGLPALPFRTNGPAFSGNSLMSSN